MTNHDEILTSGSRLAAKRIAQAALNRSFGHQWRRLASARRVNEESKQRCQEMGGPRD
jgi:hypothetical protein